ncbi:ATP-binding protein [Pararhodospirillum oryzae]|uniref:Cobyrinic acid a,c-diamide synthase n=1 Tax=Pararhodospirillum oryzae TaxID=478448 RepID=A0A512H901_9PROT|nr:ATP-binding protein [Pararhodospirillum oryzae]GEO81880.1 cobyrinic acid a,c-diamide synthase [Pararhodospirillum oryzae]
MRELSILSGKGGTGKTSVAAAFAALAHRPVLVDLDVDAANLALLVEGEPLERHETMGGQEAVIDPAVCVACGACEPACAFRAIETDASGLARVVESLCEGCGVCAHVCPAGAVRLDPCAIGRWWRASTPLGPLFHAELAAGGENSGLLVAEVRGAAQAAVRAGAGDLLLADGPPGIGCPALSALTGTTLAVLVTEPTPSGRHDLGRIIDLCAHFHRPAAVILNKADLNPALSAEIEAFCHERGHPVVGRLPFTPEAMTAVVEGRSLLSVTDQGMDQAVRSAWTAVEALLATLPES